MLTGVGYEGGGVDPLVTSGHLWLPVVTFAVKLEPLVAS